MTVKELIAELQQLVTAGTVSEDARVTLCADSADCDARVVDVGIVEDVHDRWVELSAD